MQQEAKFCGIVDIVDGGRRRVVHEGEQQVRVEQAKETRPNETVEAKRFARVFQFLNMLSHRQRL